MPRADGMAGRTFVQDIRGRAVVSRPRGTRDFAPDEMAARHWAAGRMRDAFRRFGYKEIQTPTFEELELFTAKSGEGIVSELYNFQDKGERDITLRPELTAPVMRMYHADHAFDPKPLKWFYYGSCFRYDRPQAGRYREFWQFGCEQIGAGTPLAYAELIALGDAVFDSVGLKERDLRVGHVAILRDVVAGLGLADDVRAQAMRLIDKKDMDGLRKLIDDVGAGDRASDLMGLLSAKSIGDVRDILPGGHADELAQCMEHLEALGVDAVLDMGIARGLDYYTGIVFECHSPALGAQSQLMGGGGYDLSQVFDAKATPTMGFGIGFDRTLVALEAEGQELPKVDGCQAYLGGLSADALAVVLRLAKQLRDDGVRVDIDLLDRRPGQIAKAADAAGARFLAIVGDRDVQSGSMQVKDLRNGDVDNVPLDDVRHWFLNHLGLVDMADFN